MPGTHLLYRSEVIMSFLAEVPRETIQTIITQLNHRKGRNLLQFSNRSGLKQTVISLKENCFTQFHLRLHLQSFKQSEAD